MIGLTPGGSHRTKRVRFDMTAENAQPGARYEIAPRGPELGGGWRLRLIEDGEEVGGGVFPASKTEAYVDAMDEAEGWLASRQAAPAP
jgi:hypothetical protein